MHMHLPGNLKWVNNLPNHCPSCITVQNFLCLPGVDALVTRMFCKLSSMTSSVRHKNHGADGFVGVGDLFPGGVFELCKCTAFWVLGAAGLDP